MHLDGFVFQHRDACLLAKHHPDCQSLGAVSETPVLSRMDRLFEGVGCALLSQNMQVENEQFNS